ncbi:MAG: hypothetical protein AMXMBFR64_16530 [Myxococcales bacterium]
MTTVMAMEQLWTLLGAFGGAIVVLYLIKMRRRRVRVPFGPLWQRVLPERKASALLSWLKRLLSLLVQLLVLAAIVLALAEPRLDGGCGGAAVEEPPPPTTTILVVDASASMRATDVSGGRLLAAVDAGQRVIGELEAQDLGMVVRLDSTARAVSPLTADKDVLLGALGRLRATDTGTDLRAALPFLRSLVEGRDGARVVLVTDGGFEAPTDEELEGIPLQVVRVGVGGENLALLAFHVRPSLDDRLSYEIYWRARSFVDRPVPASLLLYASGEDRDADSLFRDANVVGSYPVVLAPGTTSDGFIPDVEFPGSRFGARIVSDGGAAVRDVLPRDDFAFGVVPERKRLRVQLVTDDNLYLEAALFLRENLSFDKVAPVDYLGASGYDVTILDRFVPSELGAGNFLLVDPPREGSPFPVTGEELLPDVSRSKKGHPLMWKVSLVDLNIGVLRVLGVEPGDEVVASSQAGNPVIVARTAGEQRLVAWAFDVRASDLPLRYAFPVMIVNTLQWFAADDASLLLGRRTGTDWAVAVPWKVDRVAVRPPLGAPFEAPVVEGKALFGGAEAGIWEVREVGDGGGVLALAANLADERESSLLVPDLALPAWKPKPPPPPKPEVARTWMDDAAELVAREPWKALLLLALLVMTLEWFTYHRRMTV